ncbi:MAG: hypothetical protein KBB39_06390 [Phycicoccus sp.]|nr:hypothetical protein [Phycicoccus sp.]
MGDVAADALYEAVFEPNWGPTGPLGHLVVRRLDDRVEVARVPADDEDAARDLLARAETDLRGAATAFEATWGIGPQDAADPGPDVGPTEAGRRLVPDLRDAHQPGEGDADDPDDCEQVLGHDPRVRVLPDPAEVFSADQPWLARLLHPVVSVDLGAIDPAWSGWAHLLSPVEPIEGLLGETTARHHGEHERENWIAFHLQDDGRYRFLGDRRYFAIEKLEASDAPGADLAGYRALYAEAEAEYVGTRARYARHGILGWGDPSDRTRLRADWGSDLPLLDQLGGQPGYGNWTGDPPPAAFALDESDDTSPVLRLADGRPFTFIAATSGYPWRDQGADAILLFFEPETRTAVLTFDWT